MSSPGLVFLAFWRAVLSSCVVKGLSVSAICCVAASIVCCSWASIGAGGDVGVA